MFDKVINVFGMIDSVFTIPAVLYTAGSVVYYSVKKLREFGRRIYLRRLLGNKTVTVHIPTRDSEAALQERRIKPVVAIEDYKTFERLRTLLVNKGFTVELRYISPDSEVEFNRDNANIVVCGPKNSATTRRLFEEVDNIKFFKENGEWFLKHKVSGEKFFSPLDDRVKQYAFLGKVRDSVAGLDYLLVCGIHAIGSEGVAYLLNDNKQLDRLYKEVKNEKFCCIVKSSYNQENQIYDAVFTDYIDRI